MREDVALLAPVPLEHLIEWSRYMWRRGPSRLRKRPMGASGECRTRDTRPDLRLVGR